MHFLLHLWSIWSWTRDQQIQFLILLVLLLTLGWAIVVEGLKIRRRLSLLSYQIIRNTGIRQLNGGPQEQYNWSRVEFSFSNTSRRPIKLLACNSTTYNGILPSSANFYGTIREFHEGNHGSGGITYSNDWIYDNDLKSIVLIDSMKKEHVFYFHKGKESNKYYVLLVVLLNTYFKFLGI